MRPFEDYVASGDVRKSAIDRNLAKSLAAQAARRLAKAEHEQIRDDNADFVLEDYYDVLRTMGDAWLALNGYKSYSHEATIAFVAKDRDFSPAMVEGFDRLRRLRHGIKYYGSRVSAVEAMDARQFARLLVPKLQSKLRL